MKKFTINDIVLNIKKNSIYILIFFVVLTLRITAIQMKTSFFEDDLFTFLSMTPTNLTPEGRIAKSNWKTYNFEQGKFYTAEQIKKSLFSINPSFKYIIKDLKKIRSANIERQHPPLYFYIMRVWCIGLDSLNIKTLINYGCSLNIVFFTLSFFFMFKLLSLIKNDKAFISLGLIFAFFSMGSLINILLLRPYAMQECFLIIVCYIFMLLYKNIKQNIALTNKQILAYSAGFSLFLLSGYFSLIFFAIIYLVCFSFCMFYKRVHHVKSLILILFFTILMILFLYPSYFDFWTDNEHINTVSKNILNFNWLIINQIILSFTLIFNYILYPQIFILIFIILILKKYNICSKFFINDCKSIDKENLLPVIYLILISILWSISTIHLAPYETFRYFASASVIFSLIFTLYADKFKKYIQLFIIFLYMILSINAPFFICKTALVNGIQLPFVLTVVEKLNDNFFQEFNNNNIPLIITNAYWYNINLFIRMNDNKLVKFDNINSLNNQKLPKFYTTIFWYNIDKMNIKKETIRNCIGLQCIYLNEN